jgi:tetratricopeptide (TPR) repeat protein
LAEALGVIGKASQRLSQHPAVWNAQGVLLQRTNRWDEAYQAFSKAIKLTDDGTDYQNVRARALQQRSEVLQRQGRLDEAHTDFLQAKGIPPRVAQARVELIDLNRHYNGGLSENWRRLYENDDLASLPVGIQTLSEVEFDVRGVVQLSGQWLKRKGRKFPEAVKGIKLEVAC